MNTTHTLFTKAALPAAIAACLYMPQVSANASDFYSCAAYAAPETMCEIKDPHGATVLKVEQRNITVVSGESFTLSNEAFVPLPAPNLSNPLAADDTRLSSVDIVVTFSGNQLNTINGAGALPLDSLQQKMPLDLLGAIPGAPGDLINSQELVMANVGYDFGRELESLGGHTHDNTKYLFLTTQSAFGEEVSSAHVSFSASVDGGITLVFNPNDPYVYTGFTPPGASVGFEITDSDEDDDSQDWGLGYSYHGETPFEAEAPLTMGQEYTMFNGNIVIDGIIPIPALFLEFDGTLVSQSAATQINEVIAAITSGNFKDIPPDTKVGGNGGISLGLSVIGPVDVSIDLGQASLGIITSTAPSEAPLSAFLSGKMAAGQWEVFEGVPFSPSQAELQVSAMFGLEDHWGSPQINDESHLEISGSYALNYQAIQDLAGIDIGDLNSIVGSMKVSRDGFLLQGTSKTGPTLPFVNFTNAVEVEVNVPASNPDDFYLTLRGEINMTVGGVGLVNQGEVHISSQGAYLSIDYSTPTQEIAVSGEISNSGFLLQGSTAFILPLSMLNDDNLAELERAQREVRRLQNEIERQRDIVRGERKRDTQRMVHAQNKVKQADNKVKSINNQISAEHRSISHHKDKIAAKKRWAKKCSWVKKPWCWARYGAEAAWRGAAISGHYTKIAGLHAGRTIANSALWLARQTLEGIKQAAIHTPIDMDPRVSGLFAAKHGADLALEAAIQTIEALPELADVRGDVTVNLSHTGAGGHVAASYCPSSGCKEVLGGRLLFQPAPKACVTLPAVGEHCVGI